MPRTEYECSGCGNRTAKWLGRCPSCGEFGTLNESAAQQRTILPEMGRRGRYSETFMREAVAMVTPDRTVQEVAVRLGIAPGTLWNWVEKHRIAATVPREPRAPEVVDKTVHDAALERIRELEAENAFLGKSAAYFATKASRRT